jgi:transcriptional regulator with XRE-family HTH domain
MTELDQRRVAKAFGAVLKSTRTNAGISQEKLAELANIDRTYPSMLERGIRQPTLGRVIEVYAFHCAASGQRAGRSLHPGTRTVNI